MLEPIVLRIVMYFCIAQKQKGVADAMIEAHMSVSQRKPCAAWKVQNFLGECRHIQSMPSGIWEFKGKGRKTPRASAMEEAYGTFTNSNKTLRHADLFLSLVYGIGVFVRHRDIRVLHRKDGYNRDSPHTP
jgi:hypothetical protein